MTLCFTIQYPSLLSQTTRPCNPANGKRVAFSNVFCSPLHGLLMFRLKKSEVTMDFKEKFNKLWSWDLYSMVIFSLVTLRQKPEHWIQWRGKFLQLTQPKPCIWALQNFGEMYTWVSMTCLSSPHYLSPSLSLMDFSHTHPRKPWKSHSHFTEGELRHRLV